MADGRPAPPPAPLRVQELTPAGLRRRFLLLVPEAHVQALCDQRLKELGLDAAGAPADAIAPAPPEPVRARIVGSALADACQRAGEEALRGLLHGLRLRPAATPRLETLAGPPDGDLVLRAEIWSLPEVVPPDPAGLAYGRLIPRPDPEEEARALAALAATRAAPREMPPGTQAAAGDTLVCDIAARLLPPENHIPQPLLAGALPGAPGRMPEGWTFGDNGAGLAAEILEVAAAADPPHLRLRVHGTAATDGQSFVIFHPPRSIAAQPGGSWVGSVLVRPVGTPIGLRGAKLRLQSQGASGEGALRRKDAALGLRGQDFARCYVSDRLIEPETAFLRMPLLFDHAAGPVDFTADIALPRLVEGLDLGETEIVPLPEFSGRNRRITLGAADPAGLAPHLAGLAAGETREVTLRLPHTLEDRAIAGRAAHFALRATALLRQMPPPLDDALAEAMGFADLAAMRGFVARRVAERHAALAQQQARQAVGDALLAAAGEIPLPPDAVRAEYAALRPGLEDAARQRGAAPPDEARAMALAARRLRLRLLLGALAQRHGLTPDDTDRRNAAAGPPETLEARALEEAALRFLLERARATERLVPAAELAAALG